MVEEKKEYLLKDIEPYLECLFTCFKNKFANDKNTFEWDDRKNDVMYQQTLSAIEHLIDNNQLSKFRDTLRIMENPLSFSCILLDLIAMTEPLVPYEQRLKWIFYYHAENNLELLKDMIPMLPDLFDLMYHIGVEQSKSNHFTPKSIGLVFGGLVVRPPLSYSLQQGQQQQQQQQQHNQDRQSVDISLIEDSCISSNIFDSSFESDYGDDLNSNLTDNNNNNNNYNNSNNNIINISADAVAGTSITIFLIENYSQIFPEIMSEINEKEKRIKDKAEETKELLEKRYKELRGKVHETIRRIKPKPEESARDIVSKVLDDKEYNEFVQKLQRYKVHPNGRISIKKELQKRTSLNPFLFDKD
ncbi:hypothetical protein PPL_04833 [Heterostelium album PN500]|uniref:Uncharacterized protein n=1 Tax=Heterostelium pallidum (strain ATCC 26659 / Pp 5 / PN500) TaxID=670386 RepID=D3B8P0_HETP5|nr:hypothetical protein PPL_04833 [Heterostelium album PN500]EFA82408.1 hypothetical protein PPL_04833 [Heterostelium album PN500]|eukprot:XP_020434525.1 hypothetical protein PPL_04833 [Heterostelium album PN500]